MRTPPSHHPTHRALLSVFLCSELRAAQRRLPPAGRQMITENTGSPRNSHTFSATSNPSSSSIARTQMPTNDRTGREPISLPILALSLSLTEATGGIPAFAAATREARTARCPKNSRISSPRCKSWRAARLARNIARVDVNIRLSLSSAVATYPPDAVSPSSRFRSPNRSWKGAAAKETAIALGRRATGFNR